MAGSTFKNWKEWAQEWGLSYHKPGMLSPAREWMAGPYRGYLVKFGWRGERHVAFYAMVRFTKTSDAATLRQRLVEDPELADLPGWKKVKPTQAALKPAVFPIAGGPPQVKLTVAAAVTAPLLVDDTTLLWTLPCPWRKPNARKLAEWIEKLVTSMGFLVRRHPPRALRDGERDSTRPVRCLPAGPGAEGPDGGAGLRPGGGPSPERGAVRGARRGGGRRAVGLAGVLHPAHVRAGRDRHGA